MGLGEYPVMRSRARRSTSMSTAMTSRSARAGAAALWLAAAVVLPGCSSVVDHIPSSLGGLPAGVPPRPDTPAPFPAVHDMPPSRSDVALSDDEKKRLREDLVHTRERAVQG